MIHNAKERRSSASLKFGDKPRNKRPGFRYPLRPEGADKRGGKKKTNEEYDYVNVTVREGTHIYTQAYNEPLLLLTLASHGLIFKLALGPEFALAIVHASVDY